MPLDGHYGEEFVDKPFYHVVSCAADGEQSFADAVYGLMVGGVYFDAVPVELIKEIASAQIAVKDIVELVASDPAVVICSVDVLEEIAAEMHVDDLEPLADTQHRFFF